MSDWKFKELISAAPAMHDALQAHRAWAYAEEHFLGSFQERQALCAHAQSLTLKALAMAYGKTEPPYVGFRQLKICWPQVVNLSESDIDQGEALVAAVLDHERKAAAEIEGQS